MHAPSPARPAGEWQRALIMAPVCISTMLFMLNQTNVIVVLPHMQGAFSATRDQIAWVLTSYIVLMMIAIASAGWFAARFGRKRIYMLCLGGFGVASVLCASAESLEAMVLFRALQGICGGPIIPLSQAIVLDTYPRERHGFALGVWGVGITVGPVLGPIIGGWLTDELSWPWIFHFNLPFCALSLLGVAAFVPEAAKDRGRPFDWTGFLALAVAIGAFQYGLNRGERLDWFASSEITVAFALAAIGLYIFVVHSITSRQPFLEPAMFADRNMALGLAFIFVWGLMVTAPLVLLSLRLENIDAYPVFAIGLLMSPRGFGGIAAMLTVGRLMPHVSPKLLVVFGFSLIAWAAFTMGGWSLAVSIEEVVLAGLAFGFGIAFSYVPLTVMAFATLPNRFRTEASAMLSLTLNMGSSIGITVSILVVSFSLQTNHETLSMFVTPFHEAWRAAGVPDLWNLESASGLNALDREVSRQALAIAYNNSFRLIAFCALAVIPFVVFMTRPERPRA